MKRSESWQASAGFDLLWLSWGEDFVVYHSGSGDTHLLDAAAAGLLRSLQGSPAVTLPELSARVAAVLGMPEDEALEYTSELLVELERLALVEPSPL